MTNEEAKMILVVTQATIGITVVNNTNNEAMVNFSKKLSEAVTIACDAIDAVTDKDISIEKGDKNDG
jgi:hypothetical protein